MPIAPSYNVEGIYLFKFNNRNTLTMCEICSNLTIKTAEWHQWRRCDVFIANFEQISRIVLVFHCWLWTRKWPLEVSRKRCFNMKQELSLPNVNYNLHLNGKTVSLNKVFVGQFFQYYSVKWYFKSKAHWKLVALSSIFLCVFITQYVLMLPTYSNIFRYPASGSYKILKNIDPLSANPTKWSKTLKQVVGFYRRLVCVCSTILWGGCLKG